MSNDTKPEGFAGLIVTRKNKVCSGSWVSLYRASEAGLDSDGGEWATVCEAHSTICNHRTRQIAGHHLTSAGWCEKCQKDAETFSSFKIRRYQP